MRLAWFVGSCLGNWDAVRESRRFAFDRGELASSSGGASDAGAGVVG